MYEFMPEFVVNPKNPGCAELVKNTQGSNRKITDKVMAPILLTKRLSSVKHRNVKTGIKSNKLFGFKYVAPAIKSEIPPN